MALNCMKKNCLPIPFNQENHTVFENLLNRCVGLKYILIDKV